MKRKLLNLIKVIRLTISPDYARKVSSEYWTSQTVSLEELDVDERDGYFANVMSVLGCEPGDSVLDYGCGAGEKSVYLAKNGVDVVGADISESLMTVARTSGVDCTLIDDLYTSGRRFDRVFMHGVFMYVHPNEREEFLTKVRALVEPGGRLFLLGEPDIEKRGLGPRNPLQTKLAPILPVYQFFNASFWTRHERLEKIATASGYDSFDYRTGPQTISAPDRSHFVLGVPLTPERK